MLSDRVGFVRRNRIALAALAVYGITAFLYFGVRLIADPGSQYVGYSVDPQIFIWSFAWWPHAILHGENPFVTHAIWAPDGVNLAWTTTVPGLAVLFAPLTLLIGPVGSYNVATVLMPCFAAWTAFLLCRHITRAVWPSLVGGFLFGFSSYVLGQEEGHVHMTSVFLVPLAVLFVLRYLEGELTSRGLVVRLGPLFGLQLLFSTEVTFTLALASGAAFVIAFVAFPACRHRLLQLLRPLAAASTLAGVLTAPFIYYALTGLEKNSFNAPAAYSADLLNFAVPTKLALLSRGWAYRIALNFPGNDSEQGAYLGLPVLLILGLFAWKAPRTNLKVFLLLSLGAATLAELGTHLIIGGHDIVSLPWLFLSQHTLFDNVLPVRLALYGSLIAAVVVALWTAGRPHGWSRWLLPALAVVAILPNPNAGVWATNFSVPQFFTDRAYRSCLTAGENVLALPVGGYGDSMLWQAVNGFRFDMAGGYVTPKTPEVVLDAEGRRHDRER